MTQPEQHQIATFDQPQMALSPKDVVSRAREQARALIDIVESRNLYAVIEGKKYLEAEAWETILAFNEVSPVEDGIKPRLDSDGEVNGYDATMKLVNAEGVVVGRATMPCGFDDFPCRGKKGTAQHKAAISAAQTWALSKAARLKFSWVAVLAEYQPTPAAEMRGVTSSDPSSKYWCADCETMFFKRGKMKNYAHPKEGGGWHNMTEPEEKDVALPVPDDPVHRNAEPERGAEIKDAGQLVQWAAETHDMSRMDVIHALRKTELISGDATDFRELKNFERARDEIVNELVHRAEQEQS